MEKIYNFLVSHLQNYNFQFFKDDTDYWKWVNHKFFNDTHMSKLQKQIKKYIKLQEKLVENPTKIDKENFYKHIVSNELFFEAAQSIKSEIIARCGLEVSSMIKDNTKILDIGCNLGYLSAYYSKLFLNSTIDGVDTCKKTILKAKELHTGYSNLEFYNDFKLIDEKKYDYVTDTQCLSDIINNDDLCKLGNNIHSVLKEEGLLISISALPTVDICKNLVNLLESCKLYLQNLDPFIIKDMNGKHGYTKLIFTKNNNDIKFNFDDYYQNLHNALSTEIDSE